MLASYRRTTVKIRGAAWIALTTIVPVTCHAAAQLGFGHDIAPIIYTNCSPCHRPGEAAPFTLLSYEDVKAHAPLIAVAVGSRRMPPWLPDPAYGHYIDEHRLTDAQIRTVLDWIKEGAPEGPTSEIPPPPSFIPGWQLVAQLRRRWGNAERWKLSLFRPPGCLHAKCRGARGDSL